MKIADNHILSDSSNSYSGTLTADEINAIAGKQLVAGVQSSYVDENGNIKSVYATPLTSSAAQTLKEGWYIVSNDVKITGNSGKPGINFSGNANVILADGATMTVSSDNNSSPLVYGIRSMSNLSIYGQTQQTGKLNICASLPLVVRSIFTQNGGNIALVSNNSASNFRNGISAAYKVNINNGTLSIDIKNKNTNVDYYGYYAINVGKDGWNGLVRRSQITISGGKVKINGAPLRASDLSSTGGIITLGYRNSSDYISTDASFDAKIVQVASGQVLKISGDAENTKLFSGDITASKDEIKGQTRVLNFP